MSSHTSSSVLLLSASALLLTSTTMAASHGGGGLDAQRITQDISVAFQTAVLPGQTRVVEVYGKQSYGGDDRTVGTSEGTFSVSRSFSRLAFRAAQTYDSMHGGCTYAVTYNGPRAELPQGDSGSVFRAFKPNITAARHVPTAACPTNAGPSQQWQSAEAARNEARFRFLNRL
ncbi:MAG: hypothetical protein C0509_09060 [Acinetobacter sp.]|nr:hypothetical protein [Acinetobacter sp.]